MSAIPVVAAPGLLQAFGRGQQIDGLQLWEQLIGSRR